MDLLLPEVDEARTQVQADGQICHATATARSVPDATWKRLEAAFISGMLPRPLLTRRPSCATA